MIVHQPHHWLPGTTRAYEGCGRHFRGLNRMDFDAAVRRATGCSRCTVIHRCEQLDDNLRRCDDTAAGAVSEGPFGHRRLDVCRAHAADLGRHFHIVYPTTQEAAS